MTELLPFLVWDLDDPTPNSGDFYGIAVNVNQNASLTITDFSTALFTAIIFPVSDLQ